MTIKSDRWIRTQIAAGMIAPAAPYEVKVVDGQKVISYGVSSYGYDMRIGNEFKLFRGPDVQVVDPKQPDSATFDTFWIPDHGQMIIPPNSYVLGVSVERFTLPRNVQTVVLGKSTYARNGIIVNVTPLEPEWIGHVTIEVSNGTSAPVCMYAGEGIAQCLFFESDEPCEISYADKGGKYQNQGAVVVPGMV